MIEIISTILVLMVVVGFVYGMLKILNRITDDDDD